MKLIHTADWHLGKNIEGHSRLEEQRLFLKDFINICEEEQAFYDVIKINFPKTRKKTYLTDETGLV